LICFFVISEVLEGKELYHLLVKTDEALLIKVLLSLTLQEDVKPRMTPESLGFPTLSLDFLISIVPGIDQFCYHFLGLKLLLACRL
jgi:hypothetical protein